MGGVVGVVGVDGKDAFVVPHELTTLPVSATMFRNGRAVFKDLASETRADSLGPDEQACHHQESRDNRGR